MEKLIYIISTDNGNMETSYLFPLIDEIILSNKENKVFYFARENKLISLKSQDVDTAKSGVLHTINPHQTILKKIISDNKMNNAYVIFNNDINRSLLETFVKNNITNNVLVVRPNILLHDFEKQMISENNDIDIYLEITKNNLILDTIHDKIIDCYGDNSALYVYAQWKINRMPFINKRIVINLRENKLMNLTKQEIESDFSEFEKYIDTEYPVKSFIENYL